MGNTLYLGKTFGAGGTNYGIENPERPVVQNASPRALEDDFNWQTIGQRFPSQQLPQTPAEKPRGRSPQRASPAGSMSLMPRSMSRSMSPSAREFRGSISQAPLMMPNAGPRYANPVPRSMSASGPRPGSLSLMPLASPPYANGLMSPPVPQMVRSSSFGGSSPQLPQGQLSPLKMQQSQFSMPPDVRMIGA